MVVEDRNCFSRSTLGPSCQQYPRTISQLIHIEVRSLLGSFISPSIPFCPCYPPKQKCMERAQDGTRHPGLSPPAFHRVGKSGLPLCTSPGPLIALYFIVIKIRLEL